MAAAGAVAPNHGMFIIQPEIMGKTMFILTCYGRICGNIRIQGGKRVRALGMIQDVNTPPLDVGSD